MEHSGMVLSKQGWRTFRVVGYYELWGSRVGVGRSPRSLNTRIGVSVPVRWHGAGMREDELIDADLVQAQRGKRSIKQGLAFLSECI